MNDFYLSDIFSVDTAGFDKLALDVFYYQYKNNLVYRKYVQLLGYPLPKKISEIPFLPIELFKKYEIITGKRTEKDTVFLSSGTTGETTSKHFVSDISIYEESFQRCFEYFYGSPAEWNIFALLPAYLERKGSSLVYMVDRLIKQTNNLQSGFYLYNHNELKEALSKVQTKTLLIGVSFALLDFAENYSVSDIPITVMETGGMKGKRKEIVRSELHEILCNAFDVKKIHSEYGMTELLSQAYSIGDGLFNTSPWMKIFLRDLLDPLSVSTKNKNGVINVIDLANINSCSFIATNDLGKLHDEGFEVLGRFDYSDVRGCNLLIS